MSLKARILTVRPRLHVNCPRGAMEARRFPEPEVEGSTPSAGAFSLLESKKRSRQESNLRGQSPVDFWSTPLTAWVRLRLLVRRDTTTTTAIVPKWLRGWT